MKIKGQLQWTDYLESYLLHRQPVGLAKIFIYTFIAFCGFFFIYSLYLSVRGSVSGHYFWRFELMIPSILGVAFIVYFRYVLLPKQIREGFFKQKDLNAPFELEFTDNGMSTSNEFSTSTRQWENFVKWKENKELLLLYHSDKEYRIIPKRIFSDSQEVEIIKTYLKKNKVQAVTSRQYASCVVLIILFISVMLILVDGLRNLPSQ